MSINFYAASGLLVRTFCTLILALYIIPKQINETKRPRNQFTNLRNIILFMFIMSVVGAVPTLSYQYIRTFGGESPLLRNIATLAGNISNMATTTLLVLVYRYKIKDD